MTLRAFFAAIPFCALAGAQLTPDESAGVDRALGFWNLQRLDLKTMQPYAPDRFRFDIVTRAMTDPVATVEDLHRLVRQPSLGWRLMPGMPLKAEVPMVNVTVDPKSLWQVPEPLRPALADLVSHTLASRRILALALNGLTAEQKASLIASLPNLAAESSKVDVRLSDAKKVDFAGAVGLADKVQWHLVSVALSKLEPDRAAILTRLSDAALKTTLEKPVSFTLSGLKVWIGTKGADRVRLEPNMLALDLGGDDTYNGHPGAGLGDVGVHIDLGGADTYDLGDLGGGAGLVGIGVLWDAGGHDRFFGKSLTFGSGLFGAGVLYKEGGHNLYRSTSISQGFGMFGIGILTDTRGDDRYDIGAFGQGAGRTAGIGQLHDLQGNDVYTAGGLDSGAPLVPQSWTCFAQGSGCGYREDDGGTSGGVGILADHSGDDAYIAGTYAQGSSYWYSLGFLWDGQGHDTYMAHYYSQASAMHLTAGYLIDESGNDAYTVRTGAMHGIGHDYGVAFLLDRAGNDVYSGADSRPGVGVANGVGLFVDSAGDDRYNGPPAGASGSRDSGSVGLFVDLGGKDQYAAGLKDGEVRTEPLWAVALDRGGPEASPTTTQPQNRPKPGSEEDPGPEAIKDLYERAAKWGVGTQAEDVAVATNRLVAIGEPALQWMLENRLGQADRLSLRVFDALMSAIGKPAGRLLEPSLGSTDGAVRANAWRLARTHSVAEASAHLDAGLADPTTRSSAIGWAGAVKAEAAVDKLAEWAEGQNENLAFSSVVALAKIASPATVPVLARLVTHPGLAIRKAAIGGLAKRTDAALARGTELQKQGEREQRIGLELLAASRTDEALALVVTALDSAKAGVRLEAVRCLAEVDAAKYAGVLRRLAEDPDEDVRALVRWALGKAQMSQ